MQEVGTPSNDQALKNLQRDHKKKVEDREVEASAEGTTIISVVNQEELGLSIDAEINVSKLAIQKEGIQDALILEEVEGLRQTIDQEVLDTGFK